MKYGRFSAGSEFGSGGQNPRIVALSRPRNAVSEFKAGGHGSTFPGQGFRKPVLRPGRLGGPLLAGCRAPGMLPGAPEGGLPAGRMLSARRRAAQLPLQPLPDPSPRQELPPRPRLGRPASRNATRPDPPGPGPDDASTASLPARPPQDRVGARVLPHFLSTLMDSTGILVLTPFSPRPPPLRSTGADVHAARAARHRHPRLPLRRRASRLSGEDAASRPAGFRSHRCLPSSAREDLGSSAEAREPQAAERLAQSPTGACMPG